MTAIATPATRRTTAVSSLIDVCFIGQKSFPLHRGWDERLGILGFLLRRGELISLFCSRSGLRVQRNDNFRAQPNFSALNSGYFSNHCEFLCHYPITESQITDKQ